MNSFDLVVKNGRILDPASRFDGVLNLGIRGGVLAALTTDNISGAVEIDAAGLIVAPGFIDIHSHPDGVQENGIIAALCGVTTAIGGNCGSLLKISNEEFNRMQLEESGEIYDRLQYSHDLGIVLDEVDRQGYPINLGMLAGAWHLRLKVGANDKDHPATPQQVEALTALAETAMQQGAFGVSFGLAYYPGTSTEELEALFAAAARHDGIAAVHQRYAGVEVPGYTRDAITAEIELIDAARKTGCKLQISHIGHMIGYVSQPYDRFFLRCLEVVEQARAEGLDITADSLTFGGAGSIISDSLTEMLFSPQFKRIMGMEVEEYATISLGPHKDKPLTRELYTRLLEEAPNTPVFIDRLVMEDLVMRSILPSWVMVCSDSGLGWIRPTQPIVLGRMVRELRMLSLMDALEKMTIQPARRLGLKDKGRIMAGADADLTIFDPKEISGDMDAKTPQEAVKGIRHVIVNGVEVVRDGAYLGANPGKALRHVPWA